jgi:hypothetical protein
MGTVGVMMTGIPQGGAVGDLLDEARIAEHSMMTKCNEHGMRLMALNWARTGSAAFHDSIPRQYNREYKAAFTRFKIECDAARESFCMAHFTPLLADPVDMNRVNYSHINGVYTYDATD